MKTVMMVAALAATGAGTPKMDGARLQAGSTCYAIVAGNKTIGSTLQTVTASQAGTRPVWDIVVHQKLANGSFDVNRRPKRTPYRRAKGTPFVKQRDGYGGRTVRAGCGVGRA